MRQRILDQPIDVTSFDEASYLVKMALINKRQFKIVTLNSEMVINATKNFEFQAAINNANLIVPDSVGITLGLKFLNPGVFNGLRRIPGIELAENILSIANELGKKVAIFGGKKEVLEKVETLLKERYPKIEIPITTHGFQSTNDDGKIAEDIASYKVDVVFVALGSPKQEIWINKYSSLFPNSILIGIGGSLDVWSGVKPRAPKWMRNIYLEWLFRLLIDPKRLLRVLGTLPQFSWRVLKAKVPS
jgi:N-acetylglucosaminyldiphosphoundecaprenol N-acetyl-beta-D-mannosaminyltransferase